MRDDHPSRRGLLKASLAGVGGLILAGCDKVSGGDIVSHLFEASETLDLKIQEALLGSGALAREYSEADISPHFKPNGSTDPQDAHYLEMADQDFKDYKLQVDGLVEHPLQLSLADLRGMPARTQITRHDCVEGWSCIGKWTGVPLGHVLDRAGLKAGARYAVFHCFDSMDDGGLDGPTPFYGSIDLMAARHPQTILAYDMNGDTLTVPYGAPLRLRVERQLGYKHSKYIKRIELVASYADLGDGNGGYWEDSGYDWYAGI